ncbi:MAG: SOS response-associated peptidase family protein [Steroidobacteraceae bacterium]
MCYSARVRQDLHTLVRRFGGDVDWSSFEALFRLRLEDNGIKISRALETNFENPVNSTGERIREHIEAFRKAQASAWEQELFKQKKRLADAQRSLAEKETKRAREDERIATNKIASYLERLADLKRTESKPDDSRIFPMYFAPVVVTDAGRRAIRPLRYTCRLEGKPAFYDRKFPGTYNARRDNLTGFWSQVYGTRHAIMLVDSFFENVPTHLYQKRELAPGEAEANTVLHFQPNPPEPMIVACLWSHWTGNGQRDLHSFAAVTDEPPAEIADTGHQRCIVSLREHNLAEWLNPQRVDTTRLDQILSDRQAPYYEHRIAA